MLTPNFSIVDVRRALNGKYRVYMDEEILQALLLYYIGMKWAVHLKSAFLAFFESGAWKESPRRPMDRQARQRRQEFLGKESVGQNIRNERRYRYKEDYFLLQLPSSFNSLGDNYDQMSSEHGSRATKSPMAVSVSFDCHSMNLNHNLVMSVRAHVGYTPHILGRMLPISKHSANSRVLFYR